MDTGNNAVKMGDGGLEEGKVGGGGDGTFVIVSIIKINTIIK